MKKGMLAATVVVASAVVLSGCGQLNSALNERVETHEYLRIFDIKTTASADQVGKALAEGMAMNLSNPKIERPLVIAQVPEKPGRFELDDSLRQSNMARMMQLYGGSSTQMRLLVCKDSPWKAVGTRTSSGDWDGRVQVCLFPYKGGYHVDMYGYLSVNKGGFKELVRGSIYSVMGDPLSWMEKSLLDTVRNVRSTLKAEVTLVEARPEIKGTPWLLDPGVDVPKQQEK